jgi:excisionase family DNA binding protein
MNRKTTVRPEPEYVTIDGAAEYLCISNATVRAALSRGEIPRYKAGRGKKSRTLLRLDDVRRFVRRAEVGQ